MSHHLYQALGKALIQRKPTLTAVQLAITLFSWLLSKAKSDVGLRNTTLHILLLLSFHS